MINITLQGGLGNQLFQYALGRQLSAGGHEVTYDDRYVKRFDSEREHDRFNPQYGLHGFQFPPLKFGEPVGPVHLNDDMSWDPFALNPTGDVTLRGHWQSEKYFPLVAKRLAMEMFPSSPATEYIKSIGQKITQEDSVCVQVRRGDYTWSGNVEFHGLMDAAYYNKAIEMIGSKNIFIWSDDPEWCRQNLPGEVVVTGNRFWDIFLMAGCRHSVIANSTFGWFGAWLGDMLFNRTGRKVIAPAKWFEVKHLDSSNIVPDRWIKL